VHCSVLYILYNKYSAVGLLRGLLFFCDVSLFSPVVASCRRRIRATEINNGWLLLTSCLYTIQPQCRLESATNAKPFGILVLMPLQSIGLPSILQQCGLSDINLFIIVRGSDDSIVFSQVLVCKHYNSRTALHNSMEFCTNMYLDSP